MCSFAPYEFGVHDGTVEKVEQTYCIGRKKLGFLRHWATVKAPEGNKVE